MESKPLVPDVEKVVLIEWGWSPFDTGDQHLYKQLSLVKSYSPLIVAFRRAEDDSVTTKHITSTNIIKIMGIPAIVDLLKMDEVDVLKIDLTNLSPADVTMLYKDVEDCYKGYCSFLQSAPGQIVNHVTPPSKLTKFLGYVQNRCYKTPAMTEHLQTTIKRFAKQK